MSAFSLESPLENKYNLYLQNNYYCGMPRQNRNYSDTGHSRYTLHYKPDWLLVSEYGLELVVTNMPGMYMLREMKGKEFDLLHRSEHDG